MCRRILIQSAVNFYSGLNYLGVPTQFDPNNGASAGATFIPTALHPVNQTRSDARRAYYDPYASRPNFHVITGQQVTRIMIQGISGTTSVGTPTTGDGGTSGATSTTVLGVGLFGEGSTVPPPVTNDTIGEQRSSPRQLEAARRITGVEVGFALSSAGSLNLRLHSLHRMRPLPGKP